MCASVFLFQIAVAQLKYRHHRYKMYLKDVFSTEWTSRTRAISWNTSNPTPEWSQNCIFLPYLTIFSYFPQFHIISNKCEICTIGQIIPSDSYYICKEKDITKHLALDKKRNRNVWNADHDTSIKPCTMKSGPLTCVLMMQAFSCAHLHCGLV